MITGILIPSYCPEYSIVKLVKVLQGRRNTVIVVVDDGSGDEYREIFKAIENIGVKVIHHSKNRGKGAAIKSGILYLTTMDENLSGVVTADGDGQHLAYDIIRICEELNKDKGSLILGTRDFKEKGVPIKSKLGNRFSSMYFKFDTGVKCEDTQTGLRGIPRKLFPLALEIEGDRYQCEMEFLTKAVKDGNKLKMIPISTIYEGKNETSHFRVIKDSYLIYKSAFRYTGSSLLCACIDLSIFNLIRVLFNGQMVYVLLLATVAARLTSGVINFIFNYKWSFNSKQHIGMQSVKYASLFCLQMMVSWLSVYLVSLIWSNVLMVKIIVDSCLFIASYFVQKNWVFTEKDGNVNVNSRGRGSKKNYEKLF